MRGDRLKIKNLARYHTEENNFKPRNLGNGGIHQFPSSLSLALQAPLSQHLSLVFIVFSPSRPYCLLFFFFKSNLNKMRGIGRHGRAPASLSLTWNQDRGGALDLSARSSRHRLCQALEQYLFALPAKVRERGSRNPSRAFPFSSWFFHSYFFGFSFFFFPHACWLTRGSQRGFPGIKTFCSLFFFFVLDNALSGDCG